MITAWISIGLTIIVLILIPLLIMIIRIAMKYQQMDDQIIEIAKRSVEIEERMDTRIRWLEENIWKRR